MYFEQGDLLRGMNKDFVKEFINLAIKESHKKGYFLFREGNRANYFYILLKGRVKITIGETGHAVYTVDHPGEVFGWSSLVGRNAYSASAECREPTKILKFGIKKLQRILEKDPSNGLIFFKRLSGTLGNRLLQTYHMIYGASQPGISPSFGTGQVQESLATNA